jgi:hypothetical protein
MLIVEGPDGGGKTTLVTQLVERLRWPRARRAVNSDMTPLTTDLWEWIDYSIREENPRWIYDRHALISAMVYGPVFRNPMNTDMLEQTDRFNYKFQDLITRQKPIIIFCLPPLNELLWNLHVNRNQPAEMQRRQVINLYWSYKAMICTSGMLSPATALEYDYTQAGIDQLMGELDPIVQDRGWMK